MQQATGKDVFAGWICGCGLGRGVLTDFDLDSGARGFFCGSEEAGCNLLIHIFLSTVRAGTGGNTVASFSL